MDTASEAAVRRAINAMRENLSDPLNIDDMARVAMFSKFHFTRVFQRVTGISPGRFLSAVRLQEAKRLLISTKLNVADISLRVGYASVGTFSTRFTKSVGVPPTTYRRLGGCRPRIPTHRMTTSPTSAIHGRVYAPADTPPPDLVFVGFFPGPIPEGAPMACTILRGPGPYRLDNVPAGEGYLLVHGVTGDPFRFEPQAVCVSSVGPVTVPSQRSLAIDVELRRSTDLDAPVLIALIDTRKAALERMAGAQLPSVA
jgi:AraC family transcriptional regulator